MQHNVSNVWSAQCRSTVMWSIEWKSFSLALSKAFWIWNPNPSDWPGWIIDQRYSVNLIMRRVTRLKLQFSTLSLLQCWHNVSYYQQYSVSLASIDRDMIHWFRIYSELNQNLMGFWACFSFLSFSNWAYIEQRRRRLLLQIIKKWMLNHQAWRSKYGIKTVQRDLCFKSPSLK